MEQKKVKRNVKNFDKKMRTIFEKTINNFEKKTSKIL